MESVTLVQETAVSDAGQDDNGKCIDQLTDYQLLKKDFAICSFIHNIFNENTIEWSAAWIAQSV